MADLTPLEHEGLLGFAEAVLGAESALEWWEAFATLVLGPLLHADVVAVASIDHRGAANGTFGLIRPSWAENAVPTGSEMHVDLIADHPLTEHLRGSRRSETVRVSDLVSMKQWRAMAGYSKMHELIGATNQLNISVRCDSNATLSTSPIRARTDFTDHEVVVADRLKSLLQAADRHSRVLEGLRGSLSVAELQVSDAVARHFGLTRREEVVLGLLAEGLSTASVARTLYISARTASKHQQNLYRKLGVSDRLGAVLLAQRTGLRPVVAPSF